MQDYTSFAGGGGGCVSWENQGVDIWERARLVGALKTKQIHVNGVVVKGSRHGV